MNIHAHNYPHIPLNTPSAGKNNRRRTETGETSREKPGPPHPAMADGGSRQRSRAAAQI